MSQLTLSEFADQLNEIMSVLTREFVKFNTPEFYKVKITLPQSVVLCILHKTGESKMTDIAHMINVTTAAMTGIIDRLVKSGCVVRINDPKDRRITKVRLTPKGNQVVENMIEQRKKLTIKLFEMISQSEREEYLRILGHIRDHLK